MKRSERMKMLQSVAEHEEREQMRHLAERQKYQQQMLDRHAELKAFRSEYTVRDALRRQLPAPQWQDYQQFLSRLDRAVAEQEQIVNDGREQLDAHRKCWALKRQRVESLSKIASRYSDRELHEEERQQQRTADEQYRPGGPFHDV